MNKPKVIFMGTPTFSVPVLEMLIENTEVVLVVTQPDKEVGRHHILSPSPVKEVALAHNIPVFQPEKIKNDYELILQTPCDLIVTCAYGQIVPEKVLEYPPLKAINVHASLLPKYRGGAPIHWCLINGDEKTGVTIMYMDKGMDTGDIISFQELTILPEDNTGTLFTKLSVLGANLLKETLPSIINKTNERLKQDENLATMAPIIKREDEHLSFLTNGQAIINKIRGLNPFPLANILVNQEEFKIVEANFIKKENTIPNKVMDIKKDGIGIGCQDGIIYLTKIKPFGKKIMTVKDYLNGINKEKIKNWEII